VRVGRRQASHYAVAHALTSAGVPPVFGEDRGL
jgi:hypothetical protein